MSWLFREVEGNLQFFSDKIFIEGNFLLLFYCSKYESCTFRCHISFRVRAGKVSYFTSIVQSMTSCSCVNIVLCIQVSYLTSTECQHRGKFPSIVKSMTSCRCVNICSVTSPAIFHFNARDFRHCCDVTILNVFF